MAAAREPSADGAMVMSEDTCGSGGIEPVGEQRHYQADTGRWSLEMVERCELALGDRGAAGLALPAANSVSRATDAA